MVVVHNLILNCIFRIDLIHLQSKRTRISILRTLLLQMNQIDSKYYTV